MMRKKYGGEGPVVIVARSEGVTNVRIEKQKADVIGVGVILLRVGDLEVPMGRHEKVAKVGKVAVVGKTVGGGLVAGGVTMLARRVT